MAAMKHKMQIKRQLKTCFIHHCSAQNRPCECTDGPPHECFPYLSFDIQANKQPFAIPQSHNNSKKINELLNFSLNQQKSDEVAEDPGFISIVIHRCLETIGIKSRIVIGERKCDKNGSFKPCVWLLIDGSIVDNCYISDDRMRYLEENMHQCYKEIEVDSSILKDTTTLDANSSLKKRLYFYLRKPDFALSLGLNREQYYHYYFAMVRFMNDVHKTSLLGIDPKVRYICWCCERYPEGGKSFISDIFSQEISEDKWVESTCSSSWKFFHCKDCMVANYCGKLCQRNDWNEIHSITCLKRGSVFQSPLAPDEDN